MAKSFASKREGYVALQARVKDGLLHVQGKGQEVNRNYGVAVDIALPVDLKEWMNTIYRGYKSLYPDSIEHYFSLQAVVNNDYIHFQVSSGSPFNRDYGATFDVPVGMCKPLETFINSN